MGGGKQQEAEGDPYRSSDNAWLHPDTILLDIQSRLSSILSIPLVYIRQKAEELQVVRYHAGGVFKAHHDSSAFHPRLFTALVYLNSVPPEMGGETTFPLANSSLYSFTTSASKSKSESLTSNIKEISTVDEAIAEALQLSTLEREEGGDKRGVNVRPTLGDCLIFFNHLPLQATLSQEKVEGDCLKPDYQWELDTAAVHSGEKLLGLEHSQTQTKWIANYWVELDMNQLKLRLLEKEKE
jgi:hypothetical protein